AGVPVAVGQYRCKSSVTSARIGTAGVIEIDGIGTFNLCVGDDLISAAILHAYDVRCRPGVSRAVFVPLPDIIPGKCEIPYIVGERIVTAVPARALDNNFGAVPDQAGASLPVDLEGTVSQGRLIFDK